MDTRFFILASLGAIGIAMFTVACGDNSDTGGSGGTATTSSSSGATTSGSSTGGGSATSSSSTGGSGGGGPAASARGYYFSADTTSNAWTITVVDPTATNPVVATLPCDDLTAITGPSGNNAGPGWGDVIASPDGRRVFANASTADRVLVLETDTPSIETVLAGGKKPLHIYNPNDNHEIWSHNDTDGSFSVIDIDTLSVSAPVVAAQMGSGHGKLLYAVELGTQYFATNVNDPGGHSIDGTTHQTSFIPLCGQPCVDDPMTPEDESLNTCGGTHDKTYDPATNTAIFQCSGDTGGHVAFVDAATKQVTQDMVPMAVSAFAYTHHKEYNLIFDNPTNTVNIWDSSATGHKLDAFDATVTIPGNASGRGTDFRENEMGEWEAWIPQSTGTKLVVLNLKTLAQTEIEIGILSPPVGSTSVTRRGAIAGDWFFTQNDQGIIMVDVHSHNIVTAPQPAGYIQRVAAALK